MPLESGSSTRATLLVAEFYFGTVQGYRTHRCGCMSEDAVRDPVCPEPRLVVGNAVAVYDILVVSIVVRTVRHGVAVSTVGSPASSSRRALEFEFSKPGNCPDCPKARGCLKRIIFKQPVLAVSNEIDASWPLC